MKWFVVLRVQMRVLRWSPVWGDERLFSKEFVKLGASEELNAFSTGGHHHL